MKRKKEEHVFMWNWVIRQHLITFFFFFKRQKEVWCWELSMWCRAQRHASACCSDDPSLQRPMQKAVEMEREQRQPGRNNTKVEGCKCRNHYGWRWEKRAHITILHLWMKWNLRHTRVCAPVEARQKGNTFTAAPANNSGIMLQMFHHNNDLELF